MNKKWNHEREHRKSGTGRKEEKTWRRMRVTNCQRKSCKKFADETSLRAVTETNCRRHFRSCNILCNICGFSADSTLSLPILSRQQQRRGRFRSLLVRFLSSRLSPSLSHSLWQSPIVGCWYTSTCKRGCEKFFDNDVMK